SLALTRSPWPIGLVYGCDLAGAAAGCLGALVLLNLIDAVSALFAIAALGAAAALLFRRGALPAERAAAAPPRWLLLDRPAVLFVGLAVFALVNAAIAPKGLRLPFAKGSIETPQDIDYLRWTSYSRVRADKPVHGPAGMWGPS